MTSSTHANVVCIFSLGDVFLEIAETYSQPSQISKMNHFARIPNSFLDRLRKCWRTSAFITTINIQEYDIRDWDCVPIYSVDIHVILTR